MHSTHWDPGWTREYEVQNHVTRIFQKACEQDSVQVAREALDMALQPEHNADVQLLLKDFLYYAIKHTALLVIKYLFANGADVGTVTPADLLAKPGYYSDDEDEDEDEEFTVEESGRPVEKMIELLQLLLDHAWDINGMAQPHNHITPLLWYVCDSPELVDWCLDHGANVVIPGERTSIHPDDQTADIHHTPRHLLLLENAAAFGDIATFELLRSRGAPITPGKSWPPWHAPCLLTRAVEQAANTAPIFGEKASAMYQTRLSMVEHLLGMIRIPADEGGPRDVALNIVNSDPWIIKPNLDHENEANRDLTDLVRLLLEANANVRFLADATDDLKYLRMISTPLGNLRGILPIPFDKAVKRWEHEQLNRSKTTTVISSRCKAERPKSLLSSSSSAGQLDRLPSELINVIASCLPFIDLLSFREANRTLADHSFITFKAHLRCRRLHLALEPLKTMNKHFEQENHLIRHVEEFVILDQDEFKREDQDSPHVIAQLTKCFREAKMKANLSSLILPRGEHIFLYIVSALEQSGLALTRLELSTNGGRQSIVVDQFRKMPHFASLSTMLHRLQHINWSLTTDEKIDQQSSSLNIASLKQILGMMPGLRTMTLSWYRQGPRKPEMYFLDSCLDELLAMSKLRQLTLQGTMMAESTLYTLLSETSATKVILRYLSLRQGGKLRPILDVLTSGRFFYIELDDLHESYGVSNLLARFDTPGEVKFPVLYGQVGPSQIVREGVEAKRKLEYRFTKGRPGGSDETRRYHRLVQEKYGWYR